MSETGAGGAASAPGIDSQPAATSRALTPAEYAASRRLLAVETRAFADDVARQLADFREHAAGGIAGLESSLAAAEQAAADAEQAAIQSEQDAGIEPTN